MDDLRSTSDASLVTSVARWRQDALAELYRRHAGAVYSLARRVTGQKAVAEEVLQDVFLRLWNSPERYDPARGSLRTFLLAQSHSRSVDAVRSESSRRAREEREAREAAFGSYGIEHEVWDLTVADTVREALLELPLPERQAVQLAYFGGHTYQRVAAILGEPEGTVKSRIRSALKRMRLSLVSSGVTEP